MNQPRSRSYSIVLGLVAAACVLQAPSAGAQVVTAHGLASGWRHQCATLFTGELKCWGHNEFGDVLGIGAPGNRGDNAGEMGNALPSIDIGNLFGKIFTAATDVSAGEAHTCARTAAGEVKCWGQNAFGQLGLGDTANRGDNPGEMGNALPTVQLF